MSKPVFSGPKFTALQRKLKKQNEAFQKLSRKEQRIQIAQDVIDQLRSKELIAQSSYFGLAGREGFWLEDVRDRSSLHYLDGEEPFDTNEIEKFEKADLSEVVSQVKCEVCGIGSLFVACVKRNDKVGFTDFVDTCDDRSKEVDYLGKWFDSGQLDLIEAYFEFGHAGVGSSLVAEWHKIAAQKSRTRRLIMIMENIISNGGRFDPAKGKHADQEAVAYKKANEWRG